MKLYLIRHGETFENVGTMLMGRTHGELSPLGKEQAIKTGKALLEHKIDIIYSSPLLRCFDTATLMNEALKVPIEQDELLIERDFGIFTNASAKEVNFDMLDIDSLENQKAGVESMEQLKRRVLDFLLFIKNKYKDTDHNIIVVTHNNPLRFFLGEFLNKTYQEILSGYKVHNCGINIFEVTSNNEYRTILLDDISHLK